MGSSFLTAINLLLGFYCVFVFFKFIFKFGLPNHPAKFTLYLVSLCAASFFSIKALTELGVVEPFLFMKWRALPIVAGSLGLLLQVITTIGSYGRIQQKIISRIPLIAALLFFAFFSEKADLFFIGCMVVTFLTILVGKARYQKRMLFKMSLFLGLSGICILFNSFWSYILGQLFVFPALFYFFIFEEAYGISALVSEFSQDETSGVAS
jgi:hypothetical protein